MFVLCVGALKYSNLMVDEGGEMGASTTNWIDSSAQGDT